MKKKALRAVALLFACICIIASLDIASVNVKAASRKATRITLNETRKTLYVNQKATLKVTRVAPVNASKQVVWKSSNARVLTVRNGRIEAKRAGSATITAVSKENKRVKATCKVTVKNPTTTFSRKSVTVNMTDRLDLRKYISVKGASTSITWTSSNNRIATISRNGIVTVKRPGTVTITAKANGKRAELRVYAPSLSINKTSVGVWYPTTRTVSLSANAVSVKGQKTRVDWRTSNASIAIVKDGKVTLKKAGTVIITASANGISKSCRITARQESITLNKTSISLSKGKSERLSARVIGTNQTVTWTSSNPAVSVDKNGKVSVIDETSQTVYIYAKANGITARCEVKISVVDIPMKGEHEINPVISTLGDVYYNYIFSKNASTYHIKGNTISHTVNVKKTADRKAKLLQSLNSCHGDLEAVYRVLGLADRTITIADCNEKLNGTYRIEVKKIGEGYEVKIINVVSKQVRTLLVTGGMENNKYVFTTSLQVGGIDMPLTLSMDRDGVKAEVTVKMGELFSWTVATYQETNTSYAVSYNRSFMELCNSFSSKNMIALLDDITFSEQ